MITPVFVGVPCPCGVKHRLPAPPDGVIDWLCHSRIFKLRLHPAKFQLLLRAAPTERQLDAEGVCVIHEAAEPSADHQQRCAQCGWLLVSYRSRVDHLVLSRQELVYLPTGAHVGRAIDGTLYLARLPLSPHRERHCYNLTNHLRALRLRRP